MTTTQEILLRVSLGSWNASIAAVQVAKEIVTQGQTHTGQSNGPSRHVVSPIDQAKIRGKTCISCPSPGQASCGAEARHLTGYSHDNLPCCQGCGDGFGSRGMKKDGDHWAGRTNDFLDVRRHAYLNKVSKFSASTILSTTLTKNVKSITKPMIPFENIDQTIPRGTATLEFFVSSAICTIASKPKIWLA